MSLRIKTEVITPKKAAEYLKVNVINRPLSRHYAEQLGQAMTDGVFLLNADAIRFATLNNGNGKIAEVLVDGQHRLTGSVISGKSFETLVVRGLDPKAFDTIDQGKKRSMGDVMARRGEENYVHLASALNQLRRLEQGYTTHFLGRLRPDQAHALLDQNPKIRESVSLIRGLPNVIKLTSTGMSAALHYLFAKKDKDMADAFFSYLDTGANLTVSNPVHRLRESLLKTSLSRTRKMDPIGMCALVIKTWNLVRTKRTVKSLQWKSEEEFPEIV